MRWARGAGLLGIFVGVGVACAKESTSAPIVPGLVICHQPMTVQVDVARGPRFAWTPSCGATYLEVTQSDQQQVMWIVRGDTGKVAPGVTYGVAPPAYESRLGPAPLVPGASYIIRVGIMVDENSFAIFGEQAFVR